MKKIITDSSNFKDFIQRDAYYVDKTPQIIEFFEYSNNVILMPRPRRFGKTLFLSTINYLFSNQEKEAHLFEDTFIYDTPFFKEHFGKYPVISLTFKDVKENDFEGMLHKIKIVIKHEIKKLLKTIDFSIIDVDTESLENILHNTASQQDYENSLCALTEVLTSHYQTPCIVLIDEYDSPIIHSYLEGYYEEAISFFRNLLSAVFKGNELNIKKALLTGILRVSGESMFSGLNNIKTITILEKTLSTSCGFTREETIKLLDYYNVEKELKEEALTWYNSYLIGEDIITNPWSILNFVENKEFEPYWANTASNDFIYDLINKSKDFQINLEKLIKNEPIEVRVNKNITFRDKELEQKDNLFSLLFFSGYLKCKEKEIIQKSNGVKYTQCLMIPTNIECQMIFETVIAGYVRESFHNNRIEDLLESLTSGDLERFEELLSYALLEVVSYHDTTTENSYHMFLLGILTNLSNSYEIISNTEAGYGRVDIVLLHKKEKTKPAIVMELKKINKFQEETKEEALQKAVKQIQEKAYISLAKKRGYNNILAFGLVFDGKRCWVKMAI
ncbi:Conserved protein, with a weak D-galactarate dehydratase/altronate hydrolase domain [hydrothermal vent metagenome]|uniref:Conserved protein, with a weak D-galactarate dehydratase/altronate hydrolase domain n=1 Tax=hydrothermal vent metagenome TaxID=652676 RepID=A0A1W1D379_9ZZZZ